MSERLSATISMRRSSIRRGPSVSLSSTSRTVSGPNERAAGSEKRNDDGLHVAFLRPLQRLGAAAHVINVCRNFRSLMERVGRLSSRAAEWRTLRPHASAASRRARRIDAAPFYLRSSFSTAAAELPTFLTAAFNSSGETPNFFDQYRLHNSLRSC